MVSKDLRAFSKIALKAHPVLHAYLVNLQMYQPNWIVDCKSVAPEKLVFSIDKDFPTQEEAM